MPGEEGKDMIPSKKVLRITVAMAATGVLAFGLTACDKDAPAASGSSDDVAAQYRQLAECIRKNGEPNFPDPVQDSNGQWRLAPGTTAPPAAAQSACKSILDKIPAYQGPEGKPVTAADMTKWRVWAQCMRQKGISDWPDPNTDGSFTLPSRLGGPSGKDLYQTQFDACKPQLPPGGLTVTSKG